MSDDSFDDFMDRQIAGAANQRDILEGVDSALAGLEVPDACRAFVVERIGAALAEIGPTITIATSSADDVHAVLQLKEHMRAAHHLWLLAFVNTLCNLWAAKQNRDDSCPAD